MRKSARTSAPAPQPNPPADDPAAADEAGLLTASVARVEHRLALLDELAELSRAVRLTLDLAGRLEESLRALRSGEAKIHEARRQERQACDLSASIERAEARKERVIEQVHMVIAREAESEGDSCDLLAALDERLNDDIDYIDIDSRPLREAVERICKDLDLKP